MCLPLGTAVGTGSPEPLSVSVIGQYGDDPLGDVMSHTVTSSCAGDHTLKKTQTAAIVWTELGDPHNGDHGQCHLMCRRAAR